MNAKWVVESVRGPGFGVESTILNRLVASDRGTSLYHPR